MTNVPAPEGRKTIAHGVSHGNAQTSWNQPRQGRQAGVLPPLTGLGAAVLDLPRLTPWANFWRPYRGFA
jgi:hypothetical protein